MPCLYFIIMSNGNLCFRLFHSFSFEELQESEMKWPNKENNECPLFCVCVCMCLWEFVSFYLAFPLKSSCLWTHSLPATSSDAYFLVKSWLIPLFFPYQFFILASHFCLSFLVFICVCVRVCVHACVPLRVCVYVYVFPPASHYFLSFFVFIFSPASHFFGHFLCLSSLLLYTF